MWIALTEAKLLEYISSAELEALRIAATSTEQPDPVGGALDDVTNLVRGYCGNKNELGADGTIPDRLVKSACHIAIVDIMTRAAGTMIDPDDQRAKNSDRAYKVLEQVAKGTFAITDSDGNEQSTGGAQKLSTNTPRASRSTLKGL